MLGSESRVDLRIMQVEALATKHETEPTVLVRSCMMLDTCVYVFLVSSVDRLLARFLLNYLLMENRSQWPSLRVF